MCDCGNSLNLNCLCRANCLDLQSAGGQRKLYRNTYNTSTPGEVQRNTLGTWEYPVDTIGFSTSTTLAFLNEGARIYVVGRDATTARTRLACLESRRPELLWTVIIESTHTAGAYALSVGPWGVDILKIPNTKCRVSPDGQIIRPFSIWLPTTNTNFFVQSQYTNSEGSAWRIHGLFSDQTLDVGGLRASGEYYKRFTIAEHATLRFSGSDPQMAVAVNYYAACMLGQTRGNHIKSVTPWGAFETDTSADLSKTISSPQTPRAIECYGGGVAMVYPWSRVTLPNGNYRVRSKLGCRASRGNWTVDLDDSAGTRHGLVQQLFSDETSLWIVFDELTNPAGIFPMFFEPGTPRQSMVLRVAYDLRTADWASLPGLPMRRLDCLCKPRPTVLT